MPVSVLPLSLSLSQSVPAGLEEFLSGSGHVLSRPQFAHSCSHDQTTVSAPNSLGMCECTLSMLAMYVEP